MANVPTHFDGVRVLTKANVYFDGGVISHTVLLSSGEKKTLGLIRPGQYHFNTGVAERMEIVAGTCTVKLDGQTATVTYATGQVFDVPANSGFDIAVSASLCEYICSFLA